MRAYLTPTRGKAAWMLFPAIIAILACAHSPPNKNCFAINFDDSVSGSFIVVYKPGVDQFSTTARLAKKHSFKPAIVYRLALRGFAGPLSKKALEGVRCEPEVQFVEHDTPQMALP